MPITFNSAGGFLNGTISSSNGDIFITTSGSVGAINIGNQQLTGSQVIEKDASGKIRNKKIFNTDGTITQQKFDQNEKITETKIKNPGSGRELVQSASATSNQIEFVQNDVGALIITSGSNPGFTAFMNNVGDRAIRARGDVFVSASKFCSTGVAMDGSSLDYYIQMNHIGALGSPQVFGDSNGTGFLMVSQSGDTRVSKNLIVDGDIHLQSDEFIYFKTGDTSDNRIRYSNSQDLISIKSDQIYLDADNGVGIGVFNPETALEVDGNILTSGHITASGNISASGEYIGNQIQIYQANFSDDIATTTHFVPLGTSTFENTTEDVAHVGLVAPYDGELVKIIYRHSFDASSTTTRWVLSVIPDGTDMDGTAVTRLRATVTGATADTIKEVTVADNDGSLVDDMFFNKGETIFISLRNSSDVTTNVSTDDFHVTVVLKFNVPLGLI
tara:strand:+ start:1160 stop:2491 length:1332 start_codon:yes stop_codon:yes gene_type:complete